MAFIEVKKRTLAEVYGGTTWTVDHANLRIVEALGAARPAFHFGQVYGSLREALDDETFFEGAPSSDFAAVPLPELVRVPVRTPVPGGRFTEDHRPPSRAWILIAGDILSNGGLRLEERAIAAVEFSFAPHSLTDLCDVVPSMVTLVGEKLLKVGVDYSRNGQIRADTMLTEDGVQTSNATVFFSYSEAVAAADALQARMVAAADWRANSQLGDTVLSKAA
jgi:hypothetical protein